MISNIIKFKNRDILPSLEDMLVEQQIPKEAQIPGKVKSLNESVLKITDELIHPAGKIKSVSLEEFSDIYEGEGLNQNDDPLLGIYPAAGNLAIFVVTSGQKLCDEIDRCIAGADVAIGYALDIAASLATNNMVTQIEKYFKNSLEHDQNDELRVLSYSPGYCGWNITAQRKLFAKLDTIDLGVSINESCLMKPIKSCSGVLAAGKKEIHIFADGIYKFCDECRTHSCAERMEKL